MTTNVTLILSQDYSACTDQAMHALSGGFLYVASRVILD